MALSDLGRTYHLCGFNLYLPPDASKARRIAQRKYVMAVEALAGPGNNRPEAMVEVERAKRNFGYVLLREDKLARPHIYGPK